MALKLSDYQTIHGTQAEHWVVQGININDAHKYADITLYGYINEQAYLAGKAPIETKKTKINEMNGYDAFFSKKAKMSSIEDNIYKKCYEFVKLNDSFFKNSEDC